MWGRDFYKVGPCSQVRKIFLNDVTASTLLTVATCYRWPMRHATTAHGGGTFFSLLLLTQSPGATVKCSLVSRHLARVSGFAMEAIDEENKRQAIDEAVEEKVKDAL
ncbi:hypothetical protein ACH5RR_019782 [Cinchona calisaya]|uniref:Uncharacterized protein n=1 Tax=Cinchona calisaya TaxID=153742 RepID=A0ABD2ZRK0_9GENT